MNHDEAEMIADALYDALRRQVEHNMRDRRIPLAESCRDAHGRTQKQMTDLFDRVYCAVQSDIVNGVPWDCVNHG